MELFLILAIIFEMFAGQGIPLGLFSGYRQIALARFTAERGVGEYAAVYAEIAGRLPAGVTKC